MADAVSSQPQQEKNQAHALAFVGMRHCIVWTEMKLWEKNVSPFALADNVIGIERSMVDNSEVLLHAMSSRPVAAILSNQFLILNAESLRY